MKFLRKFRQSVIHQGSFKEYAIYTVGEILLVMIGILLALQVNNWNEKNKFQKEEQQVLQSLQIEFQDNIKNLAQILASHKATIAKIEAVLLKYDLQNERLTSITELRDAVFGKTYDPQFGVLNSLLNSDKINLIEDNLLRNKIAKIPGLLDDYSEDEKLAVQSIFEFYLPEVFKLTPKNIKSEGYVVFNYLEFLIPNIQSIIQEGEILKSNLIEDLKIIETQLL